MICLPSWVYIIVFVRFLCVSAIEDDDDPAMYFVKDHGMNTKFPPTIVRQIFEEIPIGHLRSLGFQKPPDRPVDSLKTSIDAKTFFVNYMVKNIPVTINGIVTENDPIRSTWDDERLKKIHGLSKVWVIKRHERSSKLPVKITLERFLNFYKLQDIYIASTVPDELLPDIILPKFLDCEQIRSSLVEAELWMAYGGTGSLIHFHGDHQVHCLADGRKDFILIENKFKSLLKMVEKHPFTGEGYSTIDTEMINMFQDRKIAEIPWTYTTLLAGDCLFIPAGYIHQVRSYGRSLSYSIQFAPTHSNTTGHCDIEETNQGKKTLDECDFIYTEKDGVEQIKNVKIKAENMRNILYKLIRKATVLPFERFQYFYNIAIGKVKKKMPTARVIFNNLDTKGEGFISLKQIKEMPANQLQKVANVLNSVHEKPHDEL